MAKPKQEIIKLRKDVSPILQDAQGIEVKDEKTFVKANEILSLANSKLKEIKAERKELTAPYEEKIDQITIQYSPSEQALTGLVRDLRNQIGDYQTEQTRIAEAKEKRIEDKVDRGTIKMETGARQMANIDKPLEKVQTAIGSTSFRSKPTVEIVEAGLIPREYLIPDEDVILEALKEGKNVPGCKLKILQIPINRS